MLQACGIKSLELKRISIRLVSFPQNNQLRLFLNRVFVCKKMTSRFFWSTFLSYWIVGGYVQDINEMKRNKVGQKKLDWEKEHFLGHTKISTLSLKRWSKNFFLIFCVCCSICSFGNVHFAHRIYSYFMFYKNEKETDKENEKNFMRFMVEC